MVTIRALYTYFFVYIDDELARLRVIYQFVALAAAIVTVYLLFMSGKVSAKWQIIILAGVGMPGTVLQFYRAYRDDDWLMRSWGGIRATDILGREYARIFFMAMAIVIFAALILVYWLLFTGRIPDVQ
jgi:hypothetical protein